MIGPILKRFTSCFLLARDVNLGVRPHESRMVRLFSSALGSYQCKPEGKLPVIRRKTNELTASFNFFGRSSSSSQVKVMLVTMGAFGSLLAASIAYNKTIVPVDPWNERNKKFFKEKFGLDGYLDVMRMVGLFRIFKIRVLFDTRTDSFIFWCFPDKLDEEILESICDSSNYKESFPAYLGVSKYGKHQIRFSSKQDLGLELQKYQEEQKYWEDRKESRRWWIGVSVS